MAASGVIGKTEREAFWREQVSAWRADVERAVRSGSPAISVREFCRVRGLREPSFYFWRREFERRGTEPVFAPVTVRPPAAIAAVPIELEIAGVTLRVPAGFDEANLRRLLGVLRVAGETPTSP